MATILVVDNYALTQRMLSYQLLKYGHQIIAANNEQEALDLLQETEVDLMIVDLTMPKVDGLTVLHQLRSSQRNCSLPVIMLTESSKEYGGRHAPRKSVDAFLTKSALSWKLTKTVDELLMQSEPACLVA